MEVREFNPYDLEYMNLRPMQSPELHLGGGNLIEYGMAIKQAGECFTATSDGKPIATVGLFHFWPGRRYAWAFLADDFCACKLSLTRAIHRWLRYHGQGRIETAVQCHDPKAIRWAEGFGFQREGLMRRWDANGNDCYMYARIG